MNINKDVKLCAEEILDFCKKTQTQHKGKLNLAYERANKTTPLAFHTDIHYKQTLTRYKLYNNCQTVQSAGVSDTTSKIYVGGISYRLRYDPLYNYNSICSVTVEKTCTLLELISPTILEGRTLNRINILDYDYQQFQDTLIRLFVSR